MNCSFASFMKRRLVEGAFHEQKRRQISAADVEPSSHPGALEDEARRFARLLFGPVNQQMTENLGPDDAVLSPVLSAG